MLRPICLVFRVIPLQSLIHSYLVSYLCILTFLQQLQLVVVVVNFCLEFSICNAKCLCYFQFLVDWFQWSYALSFDLGLLIYIQEYLPCLLTRVYNVSLSLFTWALYNFPVLFTWTFNKLSFSSVQCVYPVTKLYESIQGKPSLALLPY